MRGTTSPSGRQVVSRGAIPTQQIGHRSLRPAMTKGLLWDLDNVTAGNEAWDSLAAVIVSVCGPQTVLYASGQEPVTRQCRAILEAHGVIVRSGGRAPQGSDRTLLREAERLRQGGLSRLFVASHDRSFARLATWAEITVLALRPSEVSGRLRSSAHAIIALERRDGLWHYTRCPE